MIPIKMFPLLIVLSLCLLNTVTLGSSSEKSDTPAEVVIHATNFSSVPSVHHVVDAVECLKEAFSVYTEPLDRAKLYGELFQEKHNETEWNVVVGYTAVYITSQWYIETNVTNGKSGKDDKKDKDKDKDIRYLIFSKV